MPESKEQNFANHAKLDPPFHFVLVPIFALNVIAHAVMTVRSLSYTSAWSFIISLALLGLVFKVRIYSLKVQDRVIRLEERLRLARILPESMRSSISELSESQLVALRFASDAELQGLVQRTLAGSMKNKEIKQAVTNWRPDFFRV